MKTYNSNVNNQNNENIAPHVDFSLQFDLANEQTEEKILNVLSGIAKEIADGKTHNMGAIVVLGDFSQARGCVEGLVQMKPQKNPIQAFTLVDSKDGIGAIITFSQKPHDGAIIVDRTGQIIGAGVYLVVEHPALSVPEDCGTRHKAAASFSLRTDVISVLTLSEETNTIRVWKDGKPEKTIEL